MPHMALPPRGVGWATHRVVRLSAPKVENMSTENLNEVSGSGGASNSVPQTRDFLADNYGLWVQYVLSRGAHYDANGYLIYKGKILTEADTEYVSEWGEEAKKRLLTEEELRDGWLALLDICNVEGE